MRWESLTMPDFARAVTDCDGVGIIPIGVLEPHSTHMPLGTEMFESHWVACKAAEREPALVFPQYCWGVNHEAMHLPGSLVIKLENLPHWRGGEALMETKHLGHACEAETSIALHLHPELVKMEKLPDEPSPPDTRGNAVHEAGGYSPTNWYAKYPRMYVGDGRPGTAEKGKILVERRVDDLVELIRVIKADEATGAMMREFQGAALQPINPWVQN